jgi:hypothetical protein
MMGFTEWLGRYKRRFDLTSGGYGKLADDEGQAALVRRQQARDRLVTTLPNWDYETHQMLTMTLVNPNLRIDVKSLDAPHGYGPSVRHLWAQAVAQGRHGKDAWQHVVAWARHRPACWDEEDRRKKKGKAIANAVLASSLSREMQWESTDDPEHPWRADVDGARWRVRVNDFPDEILYTLLIGDEVIGEFHDWPHSWLRGTP